MSSKLPPLLALATLLIAGPALAADTETHSGTVTAIDLDRHMLESRLSLTPPHAGDFATVKVMCHRGKAIAESIDVVRPEGSAP